MISPLKYPLKRHWEYSTAVQLYINRPAKEVWPYLLEGRRDIWTKSRYTAIRGQSGMVGEVFANTDSFHGYRITYEAIKVAPEAQLVLKIMSKYSNTAKECLIGYDVHLLERTLNGTTLLFLQMFSLLVEATVDIDAETQKQDVMLFGILQNLKSLVEEKTRG